MHGLAGHAGMPYMVRAARRLVETGFVSVRLNHRGSGSGAGLSKKLYCSAMSDDVQAVLDFLVARHPGLPLFAVGYSMSGNVLMKYLCDSPQAAATRLSAAVAVCPALDLSATMESLEKRRNVLYHHRFVRQLVDQARASARASGRDLGRLLEKVRTVRNFDEVLTSADWGFQGAQDYYEKASSWPYLDRVAVKTLVLADEDDPIVPVSSARSASFSSSVKLLITRGGGHMGYLSQTPTPFRDRRWMDYAVVAALTRAL
jgi:predicted alpha/beta-fold hydrolase